jgi:hypothetical protein
VIDPRTDPEPEPDGPALARPPAFAHASEAEMARILDFYDVRWEYEPHTFPILWNLDGAVTESFSPDFWLPDLDLYLEMTTLRQRLVRKKNRKLRRLRELYPDIRIKLFYARDFRALMLKYGKLALVEALSGTPGQVLPVRPAPVPPEPAPAAAMEPVRVAEPAGAPLEEPSALPEPAAPAAAIGTAGTAARRRRRRTAAAARREAAT